MGFKIKTLPMLLCLAITLLVNVSSTLAYESRLSSADRSAETLACKITDSSFQNKPRVQNQQFKTHDIFSVNEEKTIGVYPNSSWNNLGVRALFSF